MAGTQISDLRNLSKIVAKSDTQIQTTRDSIKQRAQMLSLSTVLTDIGGLPLETWTPRPNSSEFENSSFDAIKAIITRSGTVLIELRNNKVPPDNNPNRCRLIRYTDPEVADLYHEVNHRPKGH